MVVVTERLMLSPWTTLKCATSTVTVLRRGSYADARLPGQSSQLRVTKMHSQPDPDGLPAGPFISILGALGFHSRYVSGILRFRLTLYAYDTVPDRRPHRVTAQQRWPTYQAG